MGLLNTITCNGWDNKNKAIKFITRTAVIGSVLSTAAYFGGVEVFSKFIQIAAENVIPLAAGLAAGVCVLTCGINACKEKYCPGDDDGDATADDDAPYVSARGDETDPELGQKRDRNASYSRSNSMFTSDGSTNEDDMFATVTSRGSNAMPIMGNAPLPNAGGKGSAVVGSAGVVGSVVNNNTQAVAAGSNHSEGTEAKVGGAVHAIASPIRQASATGSGTPQASGWSVKSTNAGIVRGGTSYVQAQPGTPASDAVASTAHSLNNSAGTAASTTIAPAPSYHL